MFGYCAEYRQAQERFRDIDGRDSLIEVFADKSDRKGKRTAANYR